MSFDQFIDLWNRALASSGFLPACGIVLLVVIQFGLISSGKTGSWEKSKPRRRSGLRRFRRWFRRKRQVSAESRMCHAFLSQLSLYGKNGTVSDTAHRHAHRLICKLEESANGKS
jgi:hypothetical protein